jgi:4-hydroxybutyryl-CoA dehydratase/vinylacetyl-CoA-Delta-isomerase
MLMTSGDYRESLRLLNPRVFVNGRRIESVADDPDLAPGVAAIGITYDFAKDPAKSVLMLPTEEMTGETVNRLVHINRTPQDLMYKLEAVRLLCQEVGCAQRYLTQDALNAIWQTTFAMEAESGGEAHQRFKAYLADAQARDLTLGVAMTDGKGDRSLHPHAQQNPDAYVRVSERRTDGIVLRGVKAIVTGAPYMHEFLVMPCRTMGKADADYAVCCAVPLDAEGLTIAARPAGRPGENAAKFSARYGQSTGVLMFDDVFVPWEKVFMAGEWEHSGPLVTTYATHHRHSCIAARAGFGDLLIGAGVLMAEANGVPAEKFSHIRNSLVDLIKIVEGFYACGVASSVYGKVDASGVAQPDDVFANIGKLLLSTQIYEMHKLAHEVSGGLIVSLPGPDEDHNPETGADLAKALTANPAVPYQKRMDVGRLMEDLTASGEAGWYSVISLHGGGSPEAMKREIWRNYPVHDRRELVERLLDRGVLADENGDPSRNKQPGRCCVEGCKTPDEMVVPNGMAAAED